MERFGFCNDGGPHRLRLSFRFIVELHRGINEGRAKTLGFIPTTIVLCEVLESLVNEV